MSKKANLKTYSFPHPSVSSYNIYPLLFAPKNKFFRALDFPRIFGQHPKNSAYHQNQQSERAWLSDLKAWRSTIPDRSSKGGVLRLSKENFCMIRCHVDSLFHILHLQNAGNAESSAEKCSIHRTKFDENDPISSLIPDRSSKGGVLRLLKETSPWSVAMLIQFFISYTFKTQEMQSQVLKNARFIVLNLTKMTPFRHCRSSGLKGKK